MNRTYTLDGKLETLTVKNSVTGDQPLSMSAFEFLPFLVGTLLGAFMAAIMASKYGWLGGVCGALAGATAGVVGSWAMYLLFKPLLLRSASIPRCAKGKCRSGDYSFLTPLGHDGTVYVCKCGDKYLLKGSQFQKMGADGIAEPYMKRQGILCRWQQDHA